MKDSILITLLGWLSLLIAYAMHHTPELNSAAFISCVAYLIGVVAGIVTKH